MHPILVLLPKGLSKKAIVYYHECSDAIFSTTKQTIKAVSAVAICSHMSVHKMH